MENGIDEFRPIHTEAAWWTNQQGERIFSVTNLRAKKNGRPVLLLPPFGMALANLIIPALAVANAGMHSVRFDGRNNVGVSEGEIRDFKLGVLLDDARFAARKAVEASGSEDLFIVGMSISSPVALKLASEYPGARVLLLAPAIDVFQTIEQASTSKTIFEPYRRGDPDAPRVHNVMGHDIRLRDFYDDLVKLGLGTSEDMFALAASVRGRADLILPEDDEFASREMQSRLVEAVGAQGRTLAVGGAGHDLGRSPAAMKAAFSHLLDAAQAHFGVPEAERQSLLPEAALIRAAKLDRAMIEHFHKAHSQRVALAG